MKQPDVSKTKIVAFLVGMFSPFTVSLVGEMPVGEIVLLLLFGWMALYFMLEHHLPGHLLKNRLLRWMLIAEGVALLGYMISDFVWQSSAHDAIRGWARMVFLGIDLLTVGYLFTVDGKLSLLWLEWGAVVGGTVQPIFIRPIFGDYWKFGFGTPVTLCVMLLLPLVGFWPGQAALLGLCALHFALNFRSVGGLCLVVSLMMFLLRMPLRLRVLAVPVLGLLGAAALAVIVNRSATTNRGHDVRSNISRQAMIVAALHGIRDHPFVGNGSWFGKSNVIYDFLEIRYEAAQEARLGGISREVGAPGDEQSFAIHSQILVAMAEGGLLGGTFFILYGGLLCWAITYYTFCKPWSPYGALVIYLLLEALVMLFMAPFSGPHRVYIAIASGVVLLVWRERAQERRPSSVSALVPRWKLPPAARAARPTGTTG